MRHHGRADAAFPDPGSRNSRYRGRKGSCAVPGLPCPSCDNNPLDCVLESYIKSNVDSATCKSICEDGGS